MEKLKYKISTKIIKNTPVAAGYYRIAISNSAIAKSAEPGQFVMVKVAQDQQVLLRRPLGIHRVIGNDIELLYQVVGPGTTRLSRRQAGEYLDIIGPLGNGFDYRESVTENRAPILVAGGMGVAPLLFLAEKIIGENSLSLRISKVKVLIGARTRNHVLCAKEFKALGCDVRVATEDGSWGGKGYVTTLLKRLLGENRESVTENRLYACGPRLMLKEISRICAYYHLPAQVSLEEHMACGIGACMGCAVKVRKIPITDNRESSTEYELKRVCKDGPVFSADMPVWSEEE